MNGHKKSSPTREMTVVVASVSGLKTALAGSDRRVFVRVRSAAESKWQRTACAPRSAAAWDEVFAVNHVHRGQLFVEVVEEGRKKASFSAVAPLEAQGRFQLPLAPGVALTCTVRRGSPLTSFAETEALIVALSGRLERADADRKRRFFAWVRASQLRSGFRCFQAGLRARTGVAPRRAAPADPKNAGTDAARHGRGAAARAARAVRGRGRAELRGVGARRPLRGARAPAPGPARGRDRRGDGHRRERDPLPRGPRARDGGGARRGAPGDRPGPRAQARGRRARARGDLRRRRPGPGRGLREAGRAPPRAPVS